MPPVPLEVCEDLLSRSGDLIAMRRDLHRHPELGFEEHRTAELVAERLSRAGLEVTCGLAGTGVMGILHGDRPGRTIAWRADMDALPLSEASDSPYRSLTDEVMHACGHDGHTAIGVILAEVLAKHRASLPGTAVFLFQPAEEVFGGARAMLEAGLLETSGIEEIYGLHLTSRLPVGRIEAPTGLSMASADFLEIEIRGRGGHGADPSQTVSPIAIAAELLAGLPRLVSDALGPDHTATLTICQLAAGTAPNIIPELATMTGSLRALDPGDRRALLDHLARTVKETAAGSGGRGVLRTPSCCPPLVNHEAQTAHVHACASAIVGDAAVEAGAPVLASDDMSLFLQERPGCYFRVGAALPGRPELPHHSAEFDIDEGALTVGARVAAAAILGAMRPPAND